MSTSTPPASRAKTAAPPPPRWVGRSRPHPAIAADPSRLQAPARGLEAIPPRTGRWQPPGTSWSPCRKARPPTAVSRPPVSPDPTGSTSGGGELRGALRAPLGLERDHARAERALLGASPRLQDPPVHLVHEQ